MTGTEERLRGFASQLGLTLATDLQAALPPKLRELHRAILSAFAETGAAPTVAWIAERATRIGVDPDAALTHLSTVDLVHTADETVTVAYPFSGTETRHTVALDNGPAVWAMCAGDAVGIPLMTGRDATITSTDPHTGEQIRVHYTGGQWRWQPSGTVILVAGTGGCATAAEAACGSVNFFASTDNAEAHLHAHPALRGAQLYTMTSADEIGGLTFGSLLGTATLPDREAQRAISVIRANFTLPDFIAHVYRLLAEGEPVTVERLATTGCWPVPDVRAELERQPGTEWDEHGRLVGFGVTLRPTPHAFHVDGRALYGYCATAILELPVILGRAGVGESRCATTGRAIRLELTPDGVASVDPAGVVVSAVRPSDAVTDIRAQICDLGNFFATPEAAADWLARNPHGRVAPVADEFEITRRAMTELGWARTRSR